MGEGIVGKFTRIPVHLSPPPLFSWQEELILCFKVRGFGLLSYVVIVISSNGIIIVKFVDDRTVYVFF